MSNTKNLDINRQTEASPSAHSVPYTQVSNAFIRDKRLSADARLLLIYLLSFDRGWNFHDAVIGEEVCAGRDKLARMFGELRRAGYVKNVIIRGEEGRLTGIKRIFSRTPEFLQEHRSPENPVFGEHRSPENPVFGAADSLDYIKNNNIVSNNIYIKKKEKKEKKDFSNVPEVVTDVDAEFEQFWKAYPKDMRKGKQMAKKAFKKVIRTLPLSELLKALDGQILEKFRLSQRGIWSESLPWPQKWLNQGYFGHEILSEEEINEKHRGRDSKFGKGLTKSEKSASLYGQLEARLLETGGSEDAEDF